jgi:hypothetical protein
MSEVKEVKIKNTVNRRPASVFVEGEFVEQFETVKTDKGVVTGISQAEKFISDNAVGYSGKTVEIFIAYKKFSFEEVKNVVMKEV